MKNEHNLTFGDLAESLADLRERYGLFNNFPDWKIYENAISMKQVKQ